MTGVVLTDTKMSAKVFYNLAISKRLSVLDFDFNTDGTTELKMQVLPMLLRPNMNAKMMGNYNTYKPKLVTERLVGGIRGCIGFVRDSKSGFYAPNTVLCADIRDYISNQQKIIAIFKKHKKDKVYTEKVYISKDVNGISLPSEISYLNKYF